MNGNGGDGIICCNGSDSVVSGNKVLSNGFIGIVAGDSAAGIQLTNDVGDGNDDDGIRVDIGNTTARLTKNRAFFNTKSGVDALSGGVTDGGGNKAGGNGDQHQCENVDCA